MDLTTARTLATELMTQHGLTAQRWSFRFDRAQKRLGLCTYRTRTISVGEVYAAAADEADVRDTILHEIAHALVGSSHGHGPVWKAKARELGCTPKSTGRNAAAEAEWEELVEEARTEAPHVAHLTSGPLQIGERVVTDDGRYRGILVERMRTRVRILNDADGRPWAIPAIMLNRESLHRVSGAAKPARTAPPVHRQAPPPRFATSAFAVDQDVVVHRPGQRGHGLSGVVVRVNGKTISVKASDGSIFRASPGLLRLAA